MNIRYWLITAELEGMSRYLDIVASSLQYHLQGFEESIEAMASKMTDEDQAEFFEVCQDEYIELKEDFPRRLYSSFVVSWYSFAENELLRLCDNLSLTITISVRDRDRPDKGIGRARRFLAEAARYNIKNDHWQELTTIRKIRNKIVHGHPRFAYTYDKPQDGDAKIVPVQIDDSSAFLHIDPNLHRYLEKHALLTFARPFFTIDPSLDYCQYLVGFGKEVISKIYEDLGIK